MCAYVCDGIWFYPYTWTLRCFQPSVFLPLVHSLFISFLFIFINLSVYLLFIKYMVLKWENKYSFLNVFVLNLNYFDYYGYLHFASVKKSEEIVENGQECMMSLWKWYIDPNKYTITGAEDSSGFMTRQASNQPFPPHIALIIMLHHSNRNRN